MRISKRAALLIAAAVFLLLAVLPFFTYREVLAAVPEGWSVVGETTVVFRYKTVREQLYYPDGRATGLWDYPIDRTQFPFYVQLADKSIRIEDSYQDAIGVKLVIEYKGVKGTPYVTYDDLSYGVELEEGWRLYITHSTRAINEGDYRTAAGDYFYGFFKTARLALAQRIGPEFSLYQLVGVIGAALFIGGFIYASRS